MTTRTVSSSRGRCGWKCRQPPFILFPLTVLRSQLRTACCTLKRYGNKKTSKLLEFSHIACSASLALSALILESNWLVVQPELWNFLELGGSPAAGCRWRFLQNSARNTHFTKVSHPSFRCYFPIFRTSLISLLESHKQHRPESVFISSCSAMQTFQERSAYFSFFWKVSRKNCPSFPHGSVFFYFPPSNLQCHFLIYYVYCLVAYDV